MKTSAIIACALVSASLTMAGAYAPPSPAPVAPPTPASVTVTTQIVTKKPEPNFVLYIRATPPGPGKGGDNLHFEVLVASRTGKFSLDADGLLEVFDPQQRILSCDLQGQTDGKNLKYEFDLSPQYLEKTRFSFKCTGVDEKGNVTADVVWAHVKDFSNPIVK